MQVAEINAYSSANKTITVNSIAVNKNAGNAYTQQTHAVGSKVIISDNFSFWEDIKTAINTKLNDDGSNSTTGGDFTLNVTAGEIYLQSNTTPSTSLATLAAASGADQKASVTVSDTTPAVLDTKLTAGDGISKTVGSPGGDERLDFDVDTTDTTVFVKTSS